MDYLPYLLYQCYLYKNSSEVDFLDIVNILRLLWSKYRTGIYESSLEVLSNLELMEDIGVIKLEKERNNIRIVILDPEYLKRRSHMLVGCYLYRIDSNFRSILQNIKQTVEEYYKK